MCSHFTHNFTLFPGWEFIGVELIFLLIHWYRSGLIGCKWQRQPLANWSSKRVYGRMLELKKSRRAGKWALVMNQGCSIELGSRIWARHHFWDGNRTFTPLGTLSLCSDSNAGEKMMEGTEPPIIAQPYCVHWGKVTSLKVTPTFMK